LAVYARDAFELCGELGVSRAVWIGTSLGGLVSMHVGSLKPHRTAGIVLNDIGPELAPEGLARIQSYAGKQEAVHTWAEAAAQVRVVSETQSPGLSEEEWLAEAHKRYREMPDGMIAPDYDPAIVSGPPSDVDPWWVFDRLADVPLLVLRGESSDLLSIDTVGTMRALHPGIGVVEVPERGHAPILNEPAAIHAIDVFLDQIDRNWEIED
jgi:pimeloyl-ACP methyl ester carboxylesterase